MFKIGRNKNFQKKHVNFNLCTYFGINFSHASMVLFLKTDFLRVSNFFMGFPNLLTKPLRSDVLNYNFFSEKKTFNMQMSD